MAISKRDEEEFRQIVADLTSTWTPAEPRLHRANLLYALAVVSGFGMLIIAVIVNVPLVGIAGFVVALVGAVGFIRISAVRVGVQVHRSQVRPPAHH